MENIKHDIGLNSISDQQPNQFMTKAQLSGNMGCTNELFKVYGYVPGEKDTKVH